MYTEVFIILCSQINSALTTTCAPSSARGMLGMDFFLYAFSQPPATPWYSSSSLLVVVHSTAVSTSFACFIAVLKGEIPTLLNAHGSFVHPPISPQNGSNMNTWAVSRARSSSFQELHTVSSSSAINGILSACSLPCCVSISSLGVTTIFLGSRDTLRTTTSCWKLQHKCPGIFWSFSTSHNTVLASLVGLVPFLSSLCSRHPFSRSPLPFPGCLLYVKQLPTHFALNCHSHSSSLTGKV